MDSQTIIIYTKEDFREWLKKHHKKEKKVTLILHKRHTGKSAPTHRELLEEAICFGWIDTTLKRINEDTFLRNFVKRNNNSSWSDNTLKYAKQLIKEKRMTPEGLKFYKLGLAKPTHDHGIPKNPNMPEDLKEVLAKVPKANQVFDLYPPSIKKMLYRWILYAKLPETRTKRIKRVLDSAIKGKRPNW